jgi:predicted ATPase
MRRPKVAGSPHASESGRRRIAISGVMESQARKTNVGRTATSFVGRASLLESLDRHLASGAPLVTLVGPAGAGKTRLALRFVELRAEEWTKEGCGGAWFVDLTGARDLEALCGAVAGVLDVAPIATRTASDVLHQLGHALAGRGKTLLVLDECEAIVEPVAAAITTWLSMAPEVQLLATSRERLGVVGEQRLDVGPLEVDAASLFVARAQLVRPGYAPREQEMASIEELMKRLDGLPLAIELAAARMSVLDVSTLLARLERRFEVLADRDGPMRQRTLRGALDASWELLASWERDALAQCSVFRGGFSLEAADAIVDLSAHPDAPPRLDVLQALREKSLLRLQEQAEAPGEVRLACYESIREYAAERLDHAATVHARHTRHILAMCGALAAKVTTHEGIEAAKRLRLEAENVVAVHARALANGAVTDGCLAILALEPVFAARGPYTNYVSMLDATIAAADARPCAPTLRARTLLARAHARQVQGMLAESRADLERALPLACEGDDAKVVARVMLRSATLALFEGRVDRARGELERALNAARAANDRESEGMLLGFIGMVAREEGRIDEARAQLEAALAILRDVGYRRYEGIHLANLAGVLAHEGKVADALRLYHEAIDALGAVGDDRMLALARGNLGYALQELGRHPEARVEYERALETHRRVGDRRSVGALLGFIAGLDLERGAANDARAGYRDALEILEQVGDHLNRTRMLAGLATVEATLGEIEASERTFARAEHEARRIGVDSLVDLVHVQRGHLELARARRATEDGDEVEARGHRAAAGARIEGTSAHPPSDDVRYARRLLRRALQTKEPHAANAPADALVVEAKGAWFRVPGGEVIDLRMRRAARLLLVTLVRARVESPGRALPMEDLLRGGWPGEKLIPHAGASRVYTMLTTLRNLGLRGLILSRREGHLLDPAVPIVVETLPT